MYHYNVGDVARIKSGIFEGDTFIVTEDARNMSGGRTSIARYYHKGHQFYEVDLEPVHYYHTLTFSTTEHALHFYCDAMLPGIVSRDHMENNTVVLYSTHTLTWSEMDKVLYSCFGDMPMKHWNSVNPS